MMEMMIIIIIFTCPGDDMTKYLEGYVKGK